MNNSILNRYIIFTILKTTLVVLFIAVAVDMFVELANEMGASGKGDYNISRTLLYVPMIVPGDVYSFFPMIGLLGALIGLGSLSNSSELMVMRAAGMSVSKIVFAVFTAALLICFVMTLVGELAAPKLFHAAKLYKQQSVSGNQAIETQHGVWMHVKNDFLNIQTVVDRDELVGVMRYQFNSDHQLISEAYAAQLNYINNQWQALKVQATYLNHDPIEAGSYPEQTWKLELRPEALAFGFDDPTQMSMVKLLQFVHYREAVGLPSSQYSLAFWQRVFQPIAMLVMVLLAVPCVFGMARSGSMGLRVLIGVIIGMGFYLINQLLGQFSIVYQLPVWLAALTPVSIFFLFGLWLLRRVK